MRRAIVPVAIAGLLLSAELAAGQAQSHGTGGPGAHAAAGALPVAACSAAGPQSPRDISSKSGRNPVGFPLAPRAQRMNLCNLHFHKGAEHASPGPQGFLVTAGGGLGCGIAPTPQELTPVQTGGCEGIAPGDTIEVHWVFSSCAVVPGEGLGSCLRSGEDCQLRVESQVFLLVNSAAAVSFASFDYAGGADPGGFHQPRSLPASAEPPVVYRGSTTNPAYDGTESCSPLRVTWSVRPACARLDIGSLHAWCRANAFRETHAHGPRRLVTTPALLAPID